jgi:hypothetical protein
MANISLLRLIHTYHAVFMPCPRRSHAVPLSGHAALIHTCHVVPLPFSDSALSVKVRVVAGNIRTASPTFKRIGMLLITNFVELRVVAGRRGQVADANSHTPCHVHAHTAPMPICVVALRNRFQNGMAVT